jgi:hypothetical protein
LATSSQVSPVALSFNVTIGAARVIGSRLLEDELELLLDELLEEEELDEELEDELDDELEADELDDEELDEALLLEELVLDDPVVEDDVDEDDWMLPHPARATTAPQARIRRFAFFITSFQRMNAQCGQFDFLFRTKKCF